ncbi:MAG: hypothetical protein DHS20C05_16070 [Hyphococcus sp.]|nr:MAG: hypothetical protein DHS20C05_16070 [Marinicaulis sp.]
MFVKKLTASLLSMSLIGTPLLTLAQEPASSVVEPVAMEQVSEEVSTLTTSAETTDEVEPNEDEIADDLNSRQQLEQTFTLQRTINGEVVETTKRTVTYDRNGPYRATEANVSTLERVKQAFDGEVLTRPEALEEAKLDFTIADVNADYMLTPDEFAALVDSWQENETKQAEAPTKEIARQRQYEAFLAELSPEAAEMQNEAYAKEKFAFMAGAKTWLSREDYIREYLLDFDSMDADNDTLLKGNELMRFRALNRGETIDM